MVRPTSARTVSGRVLRTATRAFAMDFSSGGGDLAGPRRAHRLADLILVLLEVVGEHLGELAGLGIVVGGVLPGLALAQHPVRHPLDPPRHGEAEEGVARRL